MRVKAGNGHRALNAHGQAVGSDPDSIIYECHYQVEDVSPRTIKGKMQGKFATNVLKETI